MARLENWNPPQLNITKATYSWDVPYAALVHEGDFASGYPARPWTDDAIGQIDFEADFAMKYKQSEDLNDAFIHVVDVLSDQSLNSILDPIWHWPRATKRKSGELVREGDRDIYDLGGLYDSQSVELEVRE